MSESIHNRIKVVNNGILEKLVSQCQQISHQPLVDAITTVRKLNTLFYSE